MNIGDASPLKLHFNKFANWLDAIRLDMPKNVCQIDEYIFRILAKEAFVKSLIQGRDFRYLEVVEASVIFQSSSKKKSVTTNYSLLRPDIFGLLSCPTQ